MYSTESLDDQEGSQGIERWMRCPTPPISAKLQVDLFDRGVPKEARGKRVQGKIAVLQSVISSSS